MLTTRYNIPIENISYEYIERLSSSRDTELELEKIIKILESGELGHYPDLLDRAREKLKQVNPNHKLAREEPTVVSRLDDLDPDLASAIKNELNDWCKQIKTEETKAVNMQESQRNLQTQEENKSSYIRGHEILNGIPNNINSQKARIKSYDYRAWDKFDPDVENKKMDVAVEREKGRIKKIELEKRDEMTLVDDMRYYTAEEKISHAYLLRVKGNDSYKADKNEEAIELYTQSLQLHTTPITLGNRAQVHIKRCHFSKALQDCEEALSIDPSYIKNIYRKALALYNIKRYEEARECFEKVLKKEPNNRTVHEYMTKLYSIVPVKLSLGPVGTHTPKIVPLDDKDENSNGNLQATKNKQCSNRKNEWGLTKRPCECTGEPKFIKQYKLNTQTQSNPAHERNNTMKDNCLIRQHKDKDSRQQKSIEEHKRKYNEFLNQSEDFRPKSILNILGTKEELSSETLASENVEIVPKSKREKGTQNPKIEIIDSVDFEEE